MARSPRMSRHDALFLRRQILVSQLRQSQRRHNMKRIEMESYLFRRHSRFTEYHKTIIRSRRTCDQASELIRVLHRRINKKIVTVEPTERIQYIEMADNLTGLEDAVVCLQLQIKNGIEASRDRIKIDRQIHRLLDMPTVIYIQSINRANRLVSNRELHTNGIRAISRTIHRSLCLIQLMSRLRQAEQITLHRLDKDVQELAEAVENPVKKMADRLTLIVGVAEMIEPVEHEDADKTVNTAETLEE